MEEFKKIFLNGVKLLVLLGLVIGLAGCEDPNANKPTVPALNGTWESVTEFGTDQYIIDGDTLTYQSMYKGSAEFVVQFAGTIQGTLADTEHGYITVKITNGGAWKKTVGKYYTSHWKERTATTVKLSSASKTNPDTWAPIGPQETDTAEEATSTFTVDNGYFGFYGNYTKK